MSQNISQLMPKLQDAQSELNEICGPNWRGYDGYCQQEVEEKIRALKILIAVREGGELAGIIHERDKLRRQVSRRRRQLEQTQQELDKRLRERFGSSEDGHAAKRIADALDQL